MLCDLVVENELPRLNSPTTVAKKINATQDGCDFICVCMVGSAEQPRQADQLKKMMNLILKCTSYFITFSFSQS